MLNRAIQVKIVKTKKSDTEKIETPEVRIEETVVVINKAFDNVVRKIGTFAIGYVAVDTLRQILVAKATKR